MEQEGIDASIGLRFSLELFKRYKSTGILQSKFRRYPGVQGPGDIYVYLIEGAVVSGYIKDKNGLHSPVSREVLIRFDEEKGPLEWSFRATAGVASPFQSTTVQSPHTEPLSFALRQNVAVSRSVTSLPGEQLLSWSIQKRRMFLLVWGQIDGKKTVRDIKAALGISVSESTVDEILQTLLELELIMVVK